MQKFLMIANPGVAPIECLTTFGVSLTKEDASANSIGQFGSGSKFSIPLLIRNGIPPVITIGQKKVNVFCKEKVIDDGLVKKAFKFVCYKSEIIGQHLSSETIETNSVLEFGIHDWTDVSMACREFVSNAIDRCLRENGNYKDVVVKIVSFESPEKISTRDEWTQIFIPVNNEIQEFYDSINDYFLHFSSPHTLIQKVINKVNPKNPSPRFYRKGVFIRESYECEKSLFDYNFGDEMRIDESRNSSDYHCASLAFTNLSRSLSASQIKKLLKAVLSGEKDLFEVSRIDPYYFKNGLTEPDKEVWREIANDILGDDGVICISDSSVVERVRAKKYCPFVPNPQWLSILDEIGVKSYQSVLSDHEIANRDLIDPSEQTKSSFNNVLIWMIQKNVIEKPSSVPLLKEFVSNCSSGMIVKGFYDKKSETIGIMHGLSGVDLLQTIIEEMCHWITKANDTSIDFQEFAFKLSAISLRDQI